MNDCNRYRKLLPLCGGGELEPAEADRLLRHLAACAACRAEEDDYSQLIQIARDTFNTEERLPSLVRSRLAAEAAAASRHGWRRLTTPIGMLWEGQSAGFVASLAACLLAIVAMPLVLRQEPIAPPPAAAGPVVIDKIDMSLEGDKVRLAWSDGTNEAYLVYKSSDPRGLEGAEVHSVRGTVWVDQNPASSPIVYYRIEAVDSPQF